LAASAVEAGAYGRGCAADYGWVGVAGFENVALRRLNKIWKSEMSVHLGPVESKPAHSKTRGCGTKMP
jgi:hypothetical protein